MADQGRSEKFERAHRLFPAMLVGVIIYGLITRLIMALDKDLNSDSVGHGIASLEIWRHGNVFLNGYYVPSADPFIFSDILPFYFIPQVLSGFNPLVLKLTGLAVFFAAVAVFSYIIYRYTGDRTKAAIFAAIAINAPPYPHFFFESPGWHTGALLFTGIFYLLLSGGKRPEESKTNVVLFAVCVAVIDLVIFSNTIVLALFAIPMTVCYLVFYRNKSRASNLLVLLANVSFGLTFYVKSSLMPALVSTPVNIVGKATTWQTNLSLYLNGILNLCNANLYLTINHLKTAGIWEYLLAGASVVIIYYILRFLLGPPEKKSRPLFVFLLVSNVLIFAGYVFTNLAVNILTSRYLILAATTVFMLVALSWSRKKPWLTAVIVLLLAGNAALNTAYILQSDHSPNAGDYRLIAYLEECDLHYGYGGYWHSNVITYLSDERVSIRGVTFGEDSVTPYLWLSNERWYGDEAGQYFIITSDSSPSEGATMSVIAAHSPPARVLTFEQYDIFVFNETQKVIGCSNP